MALPPEDGEAEKLMNESMKLQPYNSKGPGPKAGLTGRLEPARAESRAGWAGRAQAWEPQKPCGPRQGRLTGKQPETGRSHWGERRPAHTGVEGVAEPGSPAWLLTVPRGGLERNDSRTLSSGT